MIFGNLHIYPEDFRKFFYHFCWSQLERHKTLPNGVASKQSFFVLCIHFLFFVFIFFQPPWKVCFSNRNIGQIYCTCVNFTVVLLPFLSSPWGSVYRFLYSIFTSTQLHIELMQRLAMVESLLAGTRKSQRTKNNKNNQNTTKKEDHTRFKTTGLVTNGQNITILVGCHLELNPRRRILNFIG